MIPAWMERTSLLLGEEKLERLQQAHVLVVGLGGVGAYAAETVSYTHLTLPTNCT